MVNFINHQVESDYNGQLVANPHIITMHCSEIILVLQANSFFGSVYLAMTPS